MLFHQGQPVSAACHDPASLRGWKYAVPASFPSASSFMLRMHVLSIRVLIRRLWILPAPWPTASAPAQRNPLQVRYLQDAARKAAKRLPVLLRLNAGSQFGMSKEDLFTALAHRRKHLIWSLSAFTTLSGPSAKAGQSAKELAMLRGTVRRIEQTFGLRLPGAGIRPRAGGAVF